MGRGRKLLQVGLNLATEKLVGFHFISKETVKNNILLVRKSRSGGMACPSIHTASLPGSTINGLLVSGAQTTKWSFRPSSQPWRKNLSRYDEPVVRYTLFFLTIFFHFILRFWYQVFTCSWVSPRDWAKSNLESTRHKGRIKKRGRAIEMGSCQLVPGTATKTWLQILNWSLIASP